ncbi:MAG: ABC transporter ATP-binding protein [Gammaproteobacteria bacterium]|nr:ABC transporter ATP-binding protein [Gammaproteobacteria bacterium]
MLSIQELSIHYDTGAGRIEVLREIDLEIARGERVAVTGPSGSGKTTLLMLLAGLEHPSAGRILLSGTRLDTLDRDALADLRRDRVGIVFQSFHLVPSLNALDNVALPLEIAAREGARERAADLLDRVGLAGRLTHYPAQLSGGEQQRVAIARALVHGPDLVLADEPTGNLDDRTGERVGRLLFEMVAERDATLVLVSHDQSIAARCDRRLHLSDGELVESAHADPGAGEHAASARDAT